MTPVNASMKKDLNALRELKRESVDEEAEGASEGSVELADAVDCGDDDKLASKSDELMERADSAGSDMLREDAAVD